jgi:hypothetical protein
MCFSHTRYVFSTVVNQSVRSYMESVTGDCNDQAYTES